MPFFIFLGKDIYEHFSMAVDSNPVEVFHLPAYGPVVVPCMLLYLALNVATQYACISAVFVLTTECASLTVTLVVTLRKFLSLLFSIWYFQNPFTPEHWAGTFLVFGGTLLFSDVHGMLAERMRARKVEKTE